MYTTNIAYMYMYTSISRLSRMHIVGYLNWSLLVLSNLDKNDYQLHVRMLCGSTTHAQ